MKSQTVEGLQLSKLERHASVWVSNAMRLCPTEALEVMLELTPLHLVINQTDKHTMLQVTAEGYGRGKVVPPRDSMTKRVNFAKKFKGRMEYLFDLLLHCQDENVRRNWYAYQTFPSRSLSYNLADEIASLFVQERIKRLNGLSICNQVHLIWMPSYKVVAGNELVDELVRSAATSRMVKPEPYIALDPHTIMELFYKEEKGDREKYW